MTGAPEKRRDLYAKFFEHFETNYIRYKDFVKNGLQKGHIGKSTGDSNRPTFTGMKEYIYVSTLYAGGKGVRRGDVVALAPEADPRAARKKNPLDLCKRVIGLPGDRGYKEGFRSRREETVRAVCFMRGFLVRLTLNGRFKKAIVGFKGTINTGKTGQESSAPETQPRELVL